MSVINAVRNKLVHRITVAVKRQTLFMYKTAAYTSFQQLSLYHRNLCVNVFLNFKNCPLLKLKIDKMYFSKIPKQDDRNKNQAE